MESWRVISKYKVITHDKIDTKLAPGRGSAEIMSIDCLFKTLTAPGSNEILQSHNSLNFKLLKTGEYSLKQASSLPVHLCASFSSPAWPRASRELKGAVSSHMLSFGSGRCPLVVVVADENLTFLSDWLKTSPDCTESA